MATVAVFIALSGSAYAAAKINGKDIKKNTVAGKALKKDTLGSREIKESKLAEVPSAALAKRALTADNAAVAASAVTAEKVGGAKLTPIKFAIDESASPTPSYQSIFTRGDLTLSGACPNAVSFPKLQLSSAALGGYVYSTRTGITDNGFETISDGSVDAGQTVDLDESSAFFNGRYDITLKNADGKIATVTLNASRVGATDGVKCRYFGYALEY
jgi:hypothetical protein